MNARHTRIPDSRHLPIKINQPLQGWASDTAASLGISLWDYFKPMMPWFIVSNLITAIVVWKVASMFCSGKVAWTSAKHSFGTKLDAVKKKFKKPSSRK